MGGAWEGVTRPTNPLFFCFMIFLDSQDMISAFHNSKGLGGFQYEGGWFEAIIAKSDVGAYLRRLRDVSRDIHL